MYTKEEITMFIKWFIDHSEFSQREIADKLGVTAATVNRWYHGESIPNAMYFVNLAAILGMLY